MAEPVYPNIWGPGQLFAFSGVDGETNWFEGAMLLAVYAVLGVAFFYAGG